MTANTFLIKKPWITEKALNMSDIGKYVFVVRPDATSAEIKKAIKSIYGVTAIKVNIVNTEKRKKRYGRNVGKTVNFKKAIVTLKKGEAIDVVPH